MQGDDLSIFLFLAGLAATFLVAGISQANLKGKVVVGGLFALGFSTLAMSFTWKILTQNFSVSNNIINELIHSPVSWFTIGMFSVANVAFLSKSMPKNLPSSTLTKLRPDGTRYVEPTRIPTSIELEFREKTHIPTASKLENIWYWYVLFSGVSVNIPALKQGIIKKIETPAFTGQLDGVATIFLMLSEPCDYKQIKITGVGGFLPVHEVKSRDARHIILILQSSPVNVLIKIELIS